MLYVSRCMGNKKAGLAGMRYGVVDTEDGIETLVSWAQLASLLSGNPLDIKGVDYEMSDLNVNGRKSKYVRVVRISVYKGPGTLPRDKITTI